MVFSKTATGHGPRSGAVRSRRWHRLGLAGLVWTLGVGCVGTAWAEPSYGEPDKLWELLDCAPKLSNAPSPTTSSAEACEPKRLYVSLPSEICRGAAHLCDEPRKWAMSERGFDARSDWTAWGSPHDDKGFLILGLQKVRGTKFVAYESRKYLRKIHWLRGKKLRFIGKKIGVKSPIVRFQASIFTASSSAGRQNCFGSASYFNGQKDLAVIAYCGGQGSAVNESLAHQVISSFRTTP